MVITKIIPQAEFQRIRNAEIDKYEKLALIADMCRANTFASIKRAGSGHLGSSFSAMDIVVWLYYQEMNIEKVGLNSPDRDIYFSSKGHDVPGQYSVLHSLGFLDESKLLKIKAIGWIGWPPRCGHTRH